MIRYDDKGTVTIDEPGDRVRISCGKKAYHCPLPASGAVRLPLPYGDGTYEVQTFMRIQGSQYRPLRYVRILAKGTAWYLLRPSDLVPETPAWGFARELADERRDRLGIAADDRYECYLAVKNWVRTGIGVSGAADPERLPDALSCWNRQRGGCQDVAALLTGMLRAVGVPARLCMGWADGKHRAWVEPTIDGRLYRYDPEERPARVYVRERWY